MGYEITDLSLEAQKRFKKVSLINKVKSDDGTKIHCLKSLDINKNNYVDDNELMLLLQAMGKKNVTEILAVKGRGKESVNSKSNKFLKDYIIAKAEKQGIKVPEEIDITISSPEKLSDEYITLLNYVRQKIYGARVIDIFNLLNKDKKDVEQKVSLMKIADEDKNKILQLKKVFDEYYRIELNLQNKKIDVLKSNKEDLKEIEKISPEFSDFIVKEQENLRKISNKFTQGDMEAVVLAEAAETSKKFVPTLLSILALSAAYGITKSVYDAHCEKKNAAEFMKNIRETSRKKIKFINPLTDIKEKLASTKGSKWKALLALGGIIAITLGGSIDDISGCVKDYKQDKDNFGKKKALPLAIFSGIIGFLTSFLVSSTMDNAADINRAKAIKRKEFFKKLSPQQAERAKKLMKKFGPSKFGKLKHLGIIGGLGVLIAMCSSGSSWASMVGTRYFFKQNGKDLVKKNIIDKKDDNAKSTNKNMMKYEAYKGKWRGIAVGPTSDPILGSTFAMSGLLFNANPYISSATFAVQGCSETLTACGYQIFGNDVRASKLEKEKQELLNSVKANNVKN